LACAFGAALQRARSRVHLRPLVALVLCGCGLLCSSPSPTLVALTFTDHNHQYHHPTRARTAHHSRPPLGSLLDLSIATRLWCTISQLIGSLSIIHRTKLMNRSNRPKGMPSSRPNMRQVSCT
jgi:hypothetical protein